MIKTIRKAWKLPELRNKLLFVLFALLIFPWVPRSRCPISTRTISSSIFPQTPGPSLDY